jgi:hypothetical protein
MVTMRPAKQIALTCLLICLNTTLPAPAEGGFSTRDLNPLLQPIYLPTLANFSDGDGWRIDHSLYITNTFQHEDQDEENLFIDVENYRYELGLRYRQDKWLARLDLPLVKNSGGFLDSTIENWHDFFGLPQNGRDQYPRDLINLDYNRDGNNVYSRDSSTSGLGDIALAIGYQPNGGWAYFAGIELATGSIEDLSGNEAIDTALWATRHFRINEKIGSFVLLGVSFPGESDYLGGLVVDYIGAAQVGFDYRFDAGVVGTLQFDMHSRSIEDSRLTAFDESLQMLLGLGFPGLFGEHRLDLFFTEDILAGSAPDISFGLRLTRSYD